MASKKRGLKTSTKKVAKRGLKKSLKTSTKKVAKRGGKASSKVSKASEISKRKSPTQKSPERRTPGRRETPSSLKEDGGIGTNLLSSPSKKSLDVSSSPVKKRTPEDFVCVPKKNLIARSYLNSALGVGTALAGRYLESDVLNGIGGGMLLAGMWLR